MSTWIYLFVFPCWPYIFSISCCRLSVLMNVSITFVGFLILLLAMCFDSYNPPAYSGKSFFFVSLCKNCSKHLLRPSLKYYRFYWSYNHFYISSYQYKKDFGGLENRGCILYLCVHISFVSVRERKQKHSFFGDFNFESNFQQKRKSIGLTLLKMSHM